MIDGQPISAAALDAHQAATGLPRAQALDDLVDLTLLRAAAATQGMPLAPGEPTPEARAAAELALARKLKLELPAQTDLLVVDHAWVKDGPKKSITAAQRKSLEALRGRVLGGQSLPEAFKTLPGVDSIAWHIGDHEEYPYGVVPAEAHDLPPGSVSPIIAGDGGLHLFKLYARKTPPPPVEIVHALVHAELRNGHAIETADLPHHRSARSETRWRVVYERPTVAVPVMPASGLGWRYELVTAPFASIRAMTSRARWRAPGPPT